MSEFVLRQDSKNPGSTITIAKGEGKDGTNALLFTKTQSFTPSLAIPFVINDNNLLTEDDIGKTYKVSFDAKLTRGFGATTGSNIILAKIGAIGVGPVDFTASTNLTKIGCLGSIADTRVRTEYSLGQWTTITMQFTITSDMVANDADKTYLYMNAFTNIGSIHIDNVISEVTIPAKEGPYLEVVGEETTKNSAIEMNMISSSNPDTYYQRGDTVIKREDFATGAYGASKAYMQYDIVTPHLLKGASLIFNVLNDIKDGQTVDIYGFNNASFNKNTITYNNAPFNDLFTNGVNKDAVYEGGRLARIAVEKGENVIDVTSYAKEVEEGNKVSFAIVTEDTPNQVIYERNFEDGINIAVPRDVRFGGQPSVAYTVNSETGNKYLTFSNIKTTYSRARFKNVFGKPYFTSSDIGTQYKVSLSVRPSADTKFVIGIMSTYPDSSLSKLNDFSGGGLNKIDVAGGVWTDLSFVYKVSNTSVNGQVNSLSMEQLTSGVSFDVDNIKIEKIIGGDAVEIDSNVSMSVAYNEPDLTSNSVVIKEINSTGNFNKGDSVIVNAEIDTAFDKNVENVEFYLDDTLLITPNIINGNIYTQKLINVQPGTYNIRVEATFDDGETLVAEEMIEISENVSFESIKTTVSKALEGEKGYTLTKSVKSNIAKNTDVIMIVGIYDENDNLLDVIKSPKNTIGGGKYKEITATTKSLKALTKGAYAKVMIWTCDTNLPIMGSETVR